MVDILDKCTIIKVGTGVIISKTTDSVGVRIDTAAGTSNTTDSVGVRLDTAAGTAELVIIPILGCMAEVLDKCTIILLKLVQEYLSLKQLMQLV
jgi:hypothetical protein